jgi:signal recognition particle subunit SRP68
MYPIFLSDHLHAWKLTFCVNRCLAIARSHAIVGNVTNALALINHCLSLSQSALSHLSDSAPSAIDGPLSIDVPRSSLEFLSSLLNGELQRHRAIVHIDNLRKKDLAADDSQAAVRKIPLAERLHEYPTEGVDLKNVIQFPPKMALIPMKPIFLDVAWDYIDYDTKVQGSSKPATPAAPATAKKEPAPEPKQAPAKKGWFGFGR